MTTRLHVLWAVVLVLCVTGALLTAAIVTIHGDNTRVEIARITKNCALTSGRAPEVVCR